MEKKENKKRIQRITRNILIAFGISMLVLTMLSKVANSITVPYAATEKVKNGMISYEVSGEGSLAAMNEKKIDIKGNLVIENVAVHIGEKVAKGDPLVTYEMKSIEAAMIEEYQQLLNYKEQYQLKKVAYDNLIEEKENIDTTSSISDAKQGLKILEFYIEEITAYIKELEDLKAKDGILYSEVEGIVTELTVTNYVTTTGEERIVIASNECYFTGKINKSVMDYVEIGDEIQLNLDGVKNPVTMVVEKVYKSNQEVAIIQASLPKGNYTVGTTGFFSYVKEDGKTPNCVSMTAIREDIDGYYVLTPREESSILGSFTRLYRIDVKILKKDSKIAVIDGAIMNGELVVTGSNKMIEEGDVVRIID